MSNEAEQSLPEIQRTDYFDRVPQWSERGKRFEVLSDAISGRIPATRLESWRDFTELLESSFFNRPAVQLAYRGHRRYDWSLTPSLGRLTTSGIVSRELAERQLALFKRAVRGRVNDRSLVDLGEEDELWSVGQHHGLMTPLLDWTYSPYVALFFAFAKEDPVGGGEKDNSYRAVYVLNKSFVDDDEVRPEIRVMEPRKDEHGRLVNQAGLFNFSPYDATIENKLADILSADDFDDDRLKEADENEQADILAEYICKIYIKNEERDACLRHLRRMNVHHASLFPDLLGAAQYCNVAITEEELERAELQNLGEEAARAREPATAEEEEAGEERSETKEIVGIADILRQPDEASQVEPGRIGIIADELENELKKHLVVDWEDRESAQAKLRNTARVILRKYGYPANAREDVVNQIIAALAQGQK